MQDYYYSSYGLRRSSVNIVGTGSNNDDDSNNNSRKYCPRCNISLIYSQHFDTFICKRCAYEYGEEERRKAQLQAVQEPEELEEEPLASIDGYVSKAGKKGGTTVVDQEEDQALRIRPVPNSSRGKDRIERDALRKRTSGVFDKEEEMFSQKYTIVDSYEQVSSDGTYNSEELRRRQRGYFRMI